MRFHWIYSVELKGISIKRSEPRKMIIVWIKWPPRKELFWMLLRRSKFFNFRQFSFTRMSRSTHTSPRAQRHCFRQQWQVCVEEPTSHRTGRSEKGEQRVLLDGKVEEEIKIFVALLWWDANWINNQSKHNWNENCKLSKVSTERFRYQEVDISSQS